MKNLERGLHLGQRVMDPVKYNGLGSAASAGQHGHGADGLSTRFTAPAARSAGVASSARFPKLAAVMSGWREDSASRRYPEW